jgi:aerobic-type carbon monoxide dehydrogenase small subunit (CoxS/CutS family)
MAAARTITFTLNGAPVAADIKPHHNLVEMLQAQFGLNEPVFGHIWSGELHRSGVGLDVNQFDGPAVEGR